MARRVGVQASARRLAIIGSWSQPGLMRLDQKVLDTQIEQVTTARDDLAHRTRQNVRRNRAVSGIGPQWCVVRLSYTAGSKARISSPTLLLDFGRWAPAFSGRASALCAITGLLVPHQRHTAGQGWRSRRAAWTGADAVRCAGLSASPRAVARQHRPKHLGSSATWHRWKTTCAVPLRAKPRASATEIPAV